MGAVALPTQQLTYAAGMIFCIEVSLEIKSETYVPLESKTQFKGLTTGWTST